MSKSFKYPFLVVSDGKGNVFEIPELYMVGMELHNIKLPEKGELIPLPEGSDLFELPDRVAIGYDPERHEFVEVPEYQDEPVYPVAAFMAPAYVQYYRSAYSSLPNAPHLPLFSYTALGWRNEQFFVAGKRIDFDRRQDLALVDLNLVQRQAQHMRARYPQNRLVHHLVDNCVCRYGCPAARNFVLERWECPAPTSPACNSDCVGCISRQSQESGVTPPQERIAFIPTPEEIAEFTVPHLEHAPRAVISFGQGCEGEPLLVGDVLEEAIKLIRKRTQRGIINLNTNASRPDVVERLCQAGLDSMRVSLNSAQPDFYTAYYRPRTYTFQDVLESLKIVRRYQRWSSLNYFVFPGLTDQPSEVSALEQVIEQTDINMIQARNLNMDPEWYIDLLKLQHFSLDNMGIRSWLGHLHARCPWIKVGYFNPPREEMKPEHFRSRQ